MQGNQRVAAIIPAKDESVRIGATIRAARAIPHVDLVIVVDDGSEDDTQKVARAAGATVIRHSVNRGKASAMETGAGVVAMRDADGVPPRLLLFLDADLQDSALECAPLVSPVVNGEVDCTIAYLPPQEGAGGHGFVTGLGRKAIKRLTGWLPQQPLSGQRCLTRAAYEAVQPFASGWGVEVGMTIDLLVAGFTVQEIPCKLAHRASRNDLAGTLHRANQYKDVWRAAMSRQISRQGVPIEMRSNAEASPGKPYNAYRADVRPKHR
ncbi:glycosyltransferase family 2 protein [Arcanobacterium hippocoleae]|uniref:Glucosyl-3-phosphoglycerate synthase n=1 Tax=Arcanobacterium hippocoleae TaxID=149017 RepID=A0ABU1T2M7_9ACTO|nr:glycosyltransferase family 2 protein [Arcanobacterium hippocoleae]MDR6939632.1 glycosyltransferase involved in cell wall biosynthesis [Arcanobacterium hippocoleae]